MMYDINRLPDVIEIGKTGEHLFRPIQFNMRSWMTVLPEGVPSVILIRPGETPADSYIAATEFDDGILTWKPTAADVEIDGYGHIEVWLEQAAEDPEDTDPTGKSASARTHIEKSIGPAESDPPEAQASWLAQMTALKVATVDAAEDAEDAKDAAETAQGKAEDAQTAAETAQGKAEDAQTAAETAQGKAEDAQEAAEAAQAAAEAAQEAAEDAQEAAETAQGKAEDAQTAAETAQDAAEDAAEDAGDAKDDAVDAKEDAEAAQAAAEAAQAAAEAAAGTYPYIDSTTGTWMVWDVDSGAYADTGIKGHPDVIRVQDTQPTDSDGMIWFPETAPAGITVPTVAEMNEAIGALIDDTAGEGDTDKVWSADKLDGELSDLNTAISGKYTKPENGIPASDLASGVIPSVPVQDVQVDGTSILSQGVANVPLASSSAPGVVKLAGAIKGSSDAPGNIYIAEPPDSSIKSGSSTSFVAPISKQHVATFYGLAKAAGDTTQSASSSPVGQYTLTAEEKILNMIGAEKVITLTGSTPTITAIRNGRYICGEVSTLDFTPCSSGDCEVIFESGSTATVLTVPGTVKFPSWFDATNLESNATYDIIITNGVYGVVTSWQ